MGQQECHEFLKNQHRENPSKWFDAREIQIGTNFNQSLVATRENLRRLSDHPDSDVDYKNVPCPNGSKNLYRIRPISLK